MLVFSEDSKESCKPLCGCWSSTWAVSAGSSTASNCYNTPMRQPQQLRDMQTLPLEALAGAHSVLMISQPAQQCQWHWQMLAAAVPMPPPTQPQFTAASSCLGTSHLCQSSWRSHPLQGCCAHAHSDTTVPSVSDLCDAHQGQHQHCCSDQSSPMLQPAQGTVHSIPS